MSRLRSRRALAVVVLGAVVLLALAALARVLTRDAVSDATDGTGPAQTVLVARGEPRSGSYSYVLVDGGFRVYDIDDGYAMVKSVTFPDPAGLILPVGVAADARAGRLYAGYHGPVGSHGYVVAYDLRRDRVLWRRGYPVDSFTLTVDGRRLYAPCGEARADCDHWFVIDARTGDELGRIPMQPGAHNTIAALDGQRIYLASAKYDKLAVVDPRTDEIVQWIGPFRSSIRPFTINRDDSLVFVNVDFLSGFQVARTDTGKLVHTVEVQGFPVAPDEFPQLPVTQSHGIALSPDEQELWVADDLYDHVHVFDVTGLPEAAPRQIADIPLGNSPKWINFTRDGRLAHISTGEIIDRRTREVVALAAPSRLYLQIDWAEGEPVRAYSRYGLGYGDARD